MYGLLYRGARRIGASPRSLGKVGKATSRTAPPASGRVARAGSS